MTYQPRLDECELVGGGSLVKSIKGLMVLEKNQYVVLSKILPSLWS